jgi:hypothetical protein
MENKTGVRQKNLLRTVKLAICESSRMQYRRIIWLKLARVSPEQEHYHPPPSGRSPSLAIVAARFFFQCPAVYQSIVINAAKSGGQEDADKKSLRTGSLRRPLCLLAFIFRYSREQPRSAVGHRDS